MPINQIPRPGNKKQELLARKQTILSNLKYYEKSIHDESLAKASIVVFDDSSDSDSDLLPCQLNTGPTISELKDKEKILQVGLNATCELACLEILQSGVHVMIEDPVIIGEAPVLKPGLWKEVTAECRIDTVPFSITFHVHQAAGLFGAKSYRNLQILPVKKSHEVELSKSVLPLVKCPSNAVEVLRSYAVAHRSRRTTLSRLADKYAASLFMEPMAEGGYKLKCANLLEVSWVLENNKSPLAPFTHKMMFDLEYMDEAHIKIIRQAHKQLSDPTINTDDRTLLLAQIINTCLEVIGDTEEITSEVANVEDGNTNNNHDSEIMAPPATFPKKTRKRSLVENNGNAKKGRFDQNSTRNVRHDENSKLSNDKENKETNDKSAKTQNVKDKIAKTQNDADKEIINADDRVKIVKSKSKETIKVAKTGEIQKKTIAKKVQEIPKKQVNNEVKSQKETGKEINQATDEVKVLKSKTKETIKVTGSNDQNDKIGKEIQTKDKVKKGQEIAKKQINKGIESQKKAQKEIAKASDKVKILKSKSKETTEVTEKSGDQNVKAKEIQKPDKVQKVQEIPKKQMNKGESQIAVEKERKISNTKNVNKVASTDNVAESKIDGAKNNPIVKKVASKTSSKNLDKNENSAKNDPKSSKSGKDMNSLEHGKQKTGIKSTQAVGNAKPKNDNIISKTKTQNVDKGISNKKKDSENATVTKDVTNKIGTSENLKVARDGKNLIVEKKTDDISKFDPQNIVSSTPIAAKSSANLRKSEKISEAKIINIASKNKENVVNVLTTITTKNVATKSGNDKPKNSVEKTSKMTIKTLSHKNTTLKNKMPKIITGNIKTMKPTKMGNDLKSGNSSKDSNGSKISKIPQKLGIPKKQTRISLRISPRRLPSIFKSTSDSSVKPKFNQLTNIPRLMKKL